jgi:hypothetical protein
LIGVTDSRKLIAFWRMSLSAAKLGPGFFLRKEIATTVAGLAWPTTAPSMPRTPREVADADLGGVLWEDARLSVVFLAEALPHGNERLRDRYWNAFLSYRYCRRCTIWPYFHIRTRRDPTFISNNF